MTPQVSIVIPVYNEAESLRQLHTEISALDATRDFDLEILFVDDGSTDGSISVYESRLLMFGTDNVDLMPDRLSKPDVPEVVLPVAK